MLPLHRGIGIALALTLLLPALARAEGPADAVRRWNRIAVDASGLDHSRNEEARVFGEQLGPARASRAMAIVHIAIFDAVNAISGRYRSYTGLPAAPRNTSMEAAIAQAAHDTLSALFPSQAASARSSSRICASSAARASDAARMLLAAAGNAILSAAGDDPPA
jgi:hypothetical protein